MTLEERAKELRALKMDYEDKKVASDEAHMAFKMFQKELMDYMDANEVEGIKTDGINFVPTKTYYAKVTDKKKLVEWAEENDEELIEANPRKAVMNERIRQLLDDGEVFPPGLDFRVEEYISQRGASNG